MLELVLGVVVEAIGHAETVAQRAGDGADPGRGADDRHVLDLQPHRACARSLAEHHVQREVLHRGVQDLLDHVAQPVDLVDEQHVALAQAGEDGGEIPGTLDGGARCRADLRPHLGRHDVGEGRLAEAGRTVQQDVVDRLGAMLGGINQDRQVLLDARLPRELIEATRPDRGLEAALLLGDLRCRDALHGHP